jgi:hypothetical protein
MGVQTLTRDLKKEAEQRTEHNKRSYGQKVDTIIDTTNSKQ